MGSWVTSEVRDLQNVDRFGEPLAHHWRSSWSAASVSSIGVFQYSGMSSLIIYSIASSRFIRYVPVLRIRSARSSRGAAMSTMLGRAPRKQLTNCGIRECAPDHRSGHSARPEAPAGSTRMRIPVASRLRSRGSVPVSGTMVAASCFIALSAAIIGGGGKSDYRASAADCCRGVAGNNQPGTQRMRRRITNRIADHIGADTGTAGHDDHRTSAGCCAGASPARGRVVAVDAPY